MNEGNAIKGCMNGLLMEIFVVALIGLCFALMMGMPEISAWMVTLKW